MTEERSQQPDPVDLALARQDTQGLISEGQQALGSDFLYDQRLRKLERLTERAQFLHVQRLGRRYSVESFVVYALPNALGYSRLGITTSRKVGNAVRRNRWRRLIREAYRCNKPQLPIGYDLVVIVKPASIPEPIEQVIAQLIRCAHKAARYAGPAKE